MVAWSESDITEKDVGFKAVSLTAIDSQGRTEQACDLHLLCRCSGCSSLIGITLQILVGIYRADVPEAMLCTINTEKPIIWMGKSLKARCCCCADCIAPPVPTH